MRRRAARFATALVVVVSLLFMQLALASYICPVAPSGDEATAAMDMAPGMHCEDMSPQGGEQPTLCHQHCTNAAQSFEPLKIPTVTLPAVVQVLIVPLRVDRHDAAQEAIASAATGEAQPPPSPVFLFTLRLRV